MKPPKCRTCGVEEYRHRCIGAAPVNVAADRALVSPPATQPKPKVDAVRQPKAKIAAPAPVTDKPKAKKTRKRKVEHREYWRKVRGPKLKGVRKGKTKKTKAAPNMVEHDTPAATDS